MTYEEKAITNIGPPSEMYGMIVRAHLPSRHVTRDDVTSRLH